jgi:hypothetical protein
MHGPVRLAQSRDQRRLSPMQGLQPIISLEVGMNASRRIRASSVVGILAATCIIIATCAGIALSATNEDIDKAPIEKKLALLDSPNVSFEKLNPTLVGRFKTLLDMLASVCSEDRYEIANVTVKAQSYLEKNGVAESLLNIMEAADNICSGALGRVKCQDLLVMYSTLRIQGRAHQEASPGARQVIEGLAKMKP